MAANGTRKYGRFSRKSSNRNREEKTLVNKVRKLTKALKNNPTCMNTRNKLKELGRGDIVQGVVLGRL